MENCNLTKQQQDCIQKFSKLKVGALFMKMGTGKTRTALELVRYNKPDYLLYCTPKSTIANIIDEIEKWGCECEFDVAGYETIAASDKKYMELRRKLEALKNEGKTLFIIADESIFIKSGKAKRRRRCKDLRQFCDYALVLNGTPIVKDERDLYWQMDFLSEKIIQMNSYEFLMKFYESHTIKKCGREITYYTFYTPNRPAFTQMIAPYVFQADLEFDKEINEKTIWVESEYNFKQYYESARDTILENMSFDDSSFISLFTTLSQVASTCPEKNQKVADYIRGKRIICFTNYIEETEDIASRVDCYVITGATKTKDRDEILEKFKNDSKPLVMTMGVGSYSLNLQFCNEIVYSSIIFNYGKFEQSQYRIKRLGQKSDIQYTFILANLGINSMIFNNLDKKKSLANIIKKLLNEKDKEKVKDMLKKKL